MAIVSATAIAETETGRWVALHSLPVNTKEIRAAYEAFSDTDVEPLVSLMHPDLDWRGRRRGRRFWRHPGS